MTIRNLRRTCVFLLAAMAFAGSALASHLRGTTISWSRTATAGEVQFTIKYAQAGTPAVGSTLSVPFSFGDGGSANVVVTVRSVNTAEGWFLADGTVNHTYAGSGPYVASYQNCCRISTIKLGHDQSIRMETLVSPRATPVNNSPVATLPALITVPIQATAGFTVTAGDVERDPLTYRLATTQEMYGSAPNAAIGQPPGLSINSTTGQVVWNESAITAAGFAAPAAGNLWAAQFVIEDRDASGNVKSKVPVDVILKFVAKVGTAPTLSFSAGKTLSVQPNTLVAFTVTGADVDAGARVTLNANGLPAGATATNLNASLTPPVVSTFSWTPTLQQAGQNGTSYVINFTATDDTFQQSLDAVTIFVESNQPPTIDGPAAMSAIVGQSAPLTVQVADPNGDPLTVTWNIDGVTAHTDNVGASPAATAVTFAPVFPSTGAHTLAVTVTDSKGAAASLTTSVTVGKADQIVSFAAIGDHGRGDGSIELSAAASSGLPVVFSIVSGPATVSGLTVLPSGTGAITVAASQPGDATYNAAPTVVQTFTIYDLDVTSITLETRQWNGHVPADSSDAIATYFSLPLGRPGYAPGPKTVTLFDGVSNHATFGGSVGNIGYHHHFAFAAPKDGSLAIRMGADFGGGGTLILDGQVVQFRSTDMWWGGSYADPAQYLWGTVNITAGPHTIDSYGFEGCCDGAQQAQYAYYLGTPVSPEYTIFTAPANEVPVVAIAGPALVPMGQTATYTFSVTDPDAGAHFTLTALSCGGDGTLQGTPTVNTAGGSFDCGFSTPGATSQVSVQVTDNMGAQSGIAALTVETGKLPQSITFAQPAPVTYGDPDFAVSAAASSSLPVTIAASGACTVAGTIVHITGAGACTLTASQPGSAIYLAAADEIRVVNVAKAALTVTADDKSKLLGAALPPFTVRYAGFIGADSPASLGGALAFSTAATAASAVGTYAITPAGLTSPNYAITFLPGTLTVTYNVCLGYDPAKAKTAGSTIPLKLSLCDAAGANVSSPSAVVHATALLRVSNQSTGDVEDAGYANPDDNFRLVGPPYGYLFNLQSKGLATGVYQVVFTVTGDPAPHSVSFQIK